MKCQKCAKSAVVHLTEVVSDSAGKRAVEIHLCLGHAVEAGLVAPGSEVLPQVASEVPGAFLGQPAETTSIVPKAPAPPSELATLREPSGPADPEGCPTCGMTWPAFKSGGLMGCGHDYDMFEEKLLPLLKRAQEGAMEHVGKVPAKKKTVETDRQVTGSRLRKELQKAVDAENYEQAAALRDKLRKLDE